MKIVVCIKQVPALEHMRFDHETRRLIREGVPNSINAFDRRAITEAVRLREQFGGEVVVITMGPPQARDALSEALMMGCDRAVHLLGREFAGADTIATARTLTLACRKIGFDLVFCGKYSTDAETAQIPPMLAEFLDVPQVTGVTALDVSPGGEAIKAKRELDDGFETVECSLPAVLSAGERLNRPIRVGPADAPKAEGKPIDVWGAQELDADLSMLGIEGSPTWVERIYSIEPARKRVMLASGDLEQDVRQLFAFLREEGWGAHEWRSKPHVHIRAADRRPYTSGAPSIWVVAEAVRCHLREVTLEMLGRGISLANWLDGELAAVLLGHRVGEYFMTLGAYGADKVYVADAPALADYTTEAYAGILSGAIEQYHPFAVLLASTANGRDLAPRVAARLNLGLTGDAIGVEISVAGHFVMLKPAYGGNIVAPILSKTVPSLVTIRPGMLQKAEPDYKRTPAVIDLPAGILRPRTRVVEREVSAVEGLELDSAEVVLGVGTGIGGPENLPWVKEFAGRINAPLAATRKVVDNGWMPRQYQVGLTGKSIAPRLYFALGISGQFNHMVGIQRSGIIVAVDPNPNAPIFKQADYGIVAGWREFIEAASRVLAETPAPAR